LKQQQGWPDLAIVHQISERSWMLRHQYGCHDLGRADFSQRRPNLRGSKVIAK
jgi:hypothetical protein